ncbi:hypothetical protein GLU60_02720 [Nanohaloarchaea archaeon H01]|nr:hypothetical protein [Nanohaloarchaea archaeon H01]
MSYEILEHSADEKFRAEGGALEEAFSEAVKAFAEIVGADPEAGQVRHSIQIESENSEALLFDFLDRLVFLQDTEDVVVNQAKELSIEEKEDGYRLKATLWTDPIDESSDYLDIKAPTYNEMKVDYDESWIIEAVIDI